MPEKEITEKRFLKKFEANTDEEVIKQINEFSSKLNGKIMNYSLDKSRDGNTVAIIFYSQLLERH